MPVEQEKRLQCMNVWGGNRSTDTSFTTAGLDIWVYSSPYMNAESGGDIYQISSCSSGSISRLLLADVSGHGIKVSQIAQQLSNIMYKHISEISQNKLVSEINREFTLWEESDAFATALICTYFAPSRKLALSNAGHPKPFLYRSASNSWEFLQTSTKQDQRNLPLGVLPDHAVSGSECQLEKGDMVLLYTDALPDAFNEHGVQFNEAGLLNLVKEIQTQPPGQFLRTLINHLSSLNNNNLKNDDCTMILISANGTQARLLDFAAAPYRLIKSLLGFRPK